MEDREENLNTSFEYMEELSRAYQEAFLKRLGKTSPSLSPEGRETLVKWQWEIRFLARKYTHLVAREEKKELGHMIQESADEILCRSGYREEEMSGAERLSRQGADEILTRAVLLANRSLNLLIRHRPSEEGVTFLVLSELSALYALASIH